MRIFHGLERFSEDLDFALVNPDPEYDLQRYLPQLRNELFVYGYELEIVDRSRSEDVVKKAFLKDSSLGKQLTLRYPYLSGGQRKIRIKLEVDTNPPPSGNTIIAYHNYPLPFSATVYDLPSLFAGKIHALLCREYVKGRDWYDLLWYLRFKVHPNAEFLKAALFQTDHLENDKEVISTEWIKQKLKDRIKTLDWTKAREDIIRFVKPYEHDSIKLWNAELFLSVLEKASYSPPEK